MADRHRFHLDQDGHSITVVRDLRHRHAEVLVDGKTVSSGRTSRSEATVLRGEIAGAGRPQGFLVRLERPDVPGGEPLCVLEKDGMRYLMPSVALTPQEEWPAERNPSPRTPGELLARWRGRH
ncbi:MULTISPECIES: hypothetical protein [unclassified Streptomyces]|uniref:hypothetical protein n=1 Tax=unclassified Streptomyces TaxID=2593676 RepID=UPI002481B136|nr:MULTISPECIES: hypothetical protein [unclassified Streptomyces]MDA5283446.1 hypothetical protein [Streptomyces sp. Isolate_45]MDX2389008.1 hypothetical protein [Streptomyces sp. DK15]